MKFSFNSILTAILLATVLVSCSEQKSESKKSAQQPGGQSQRATDVGFIDIEPVLVHRTNEVPGRVVAY